MDEFYDQAKAEQMDNYRVHSFTQPRAWRLCVGEIEEALEEATFRVQGVLCGKDLPPVTLSGARSSRLRSRKYIRQHVKLTGMGSNDMIQCIQQAEAAYLKMLNHFKEGALEPWQPSMFEGKAAIEANTRYFTQASHAQASDAVDFAPYVDSNGQLKAVMEGEYVHTIDNRVDYMEQVTNGDGVKA
ncbi:hypothetical protein MD484_g5957, partial [Candolleomyces efflorescens]